MSHTYLLQSIVFPRTHARTHVCRTHLVSLSLSWPVVNLLTHHKFSAHTRPTQPKQNLTSAIIFIIIDSYRSYAMELMCVRNPRHNLYVREYHVHGLVFYLVFTVAQLCLRACDGQCDARNDGPTEMCQHTHIRTRANTSFTYIPSWYWVICTANAAEPESCDDVRDAIGLNVARTRRRRLYPLNIAHTRISWTIYKHML